MFYIDMKQQKGLKNKDKSIEQNQIKFLDNTFFKDTNEIKIKDKILLKSSEKISHYVQNISDTNLKNNNYSILSE